MTLLDGHTLLNFYFASSTVLLPPSSTAPSCPICLAPMERIVDRSLTQLVKRRQLIVATGSPHITKLKAPHSPPVT